MGLPSLAGHIDETLAEKSDGKQMERDERLSPEAANAAQKAHDDYLKRARRKQLDKINGDAYWAWLRTGRKGPCPQDIIDPSLE